MPILQWIVSFLFIVIYSQRAIIDFFFNSAEIEGLFLKFFLVAAIGQYLHFAYGVINQMCNELNIRCLHIPAPKKQ